jgi:hypothetical protein
MADIWNIGLNLALRITDLLSIKFDDIHSDRLIIKISLPTTHAGHLASWNSHDEKSPKKPVGNQLFWSLYILYKLAI